MKITKQSETYTFELGNNLADVRIHFKQNRFYIFRRAVKDESFIDQINYFAQRKLDDYETQGK